MSSNADAQDRTSKDWAAKFRIPGLETWTGVGAFTGMLIAACSLLFYISGELFVLETRSPLISYLPILISGAAILGTQIARVLRLQSLRKIGRKIGFREIFAYLLLNLIMIVTLGILNVSNVLPEVTDAAASSQRSIVLLLLLFASFIPVLTASTFNEISELKSLPSEKPRPFFRADAISPWTLGIGGGLLIVMVTLAWAMGANKLSGIMNETYFSLGWIVLVIGIFLLFVFAPHLRRAHNNHNERRSLKTVGAGVTSISLLPRWASYIDSMLVRILAPITGATQLGGPIPHLLVISIMLLLATLGFVLPSPFGLAPIAFAIILALALGRRWAWIEGDRDTAARLQDTESEQIHIGFDNDLRDEALLGYTALFILVPLALYQLDQWIGGFVSTGTESGFVIVDWLRFFGAELAKAVPFVDWWEIYRNDMDSGFQPSEGSPIGLHLTFASRAIVDLVIMAALFQAISISQRTRQQEKLYKAGEINAFDPFKERDFFESGIMKANPDRYASLDGEYFNIGNRKVPKRIQLSDLFTDGSDYFEIKDAFAAELNSHLEKRQAHTSASCPYNQVRLSKLQHSENIDLKVGARWMIEHFHVLVGTSTDKIGQLNRRWHGFLHDSESNPFANPVKSPLFRQQKDDFETVVDDALTKDCLLQESSIHQLSTLACIANGKTSFEYATSMAYTLLSRQTDDAAFYSLCPSVLETNMHKNHFVDLKDKFPVWLEAEGPPYQKRSHMRIAAYEAINRLRLKSETPIVRISATALLEYMQVENQGDRSKDARDAIKEMLRT